MPIFETLEDLAGAGIAAGPLIGLDPGTKTIGVAASDPSRLMAMPVETVRKTKFTADAERLLALTAERKAAAIVLGLPRNMDGSEGPRCQSTRAFARNLDIVFENEDLHELDVFILLDGAKPIVVECKSGEFRQDIEKYLKLRRRLGIDRSQFIVFSPDLAEDQAAALSNMYELTFANRERLTAHLRSLIH